jgi:hypothetical protein
MNSPETYRRIPNFHEVERCCGSDETGWLFEESNATIGLRRAQHRDNYFLLFCLARTGSTSLAKALSAHQHIRCIIEPFIRERFGGRYLTRISDDASLAGCVDEIHRRYNGIKHVWTPAGWPFHDARLNRSLATRPDQKLVILKRKNVLKRLVSRQISQQMDVWDIDDVPERSAIHRFPFQPLDLKALETALREERSALDICSGLAAVNPSKTLSIWYEDLFPETDSTGEAAEATVQRVIEFLGFPAPDERSRYEMRQYLTPDKKMNSMATYSLIPRILEVESRFGSDACGWLFKD